MKQLAFSNGVGRGMDSNLFSDKCLALHCRSDTGGPPGESHSIGLLLYSMHDEYGMLSGLPYCFL